MGPQMEPKEHFDRVPKTDMVNMRFKYPPGYPPGGGGDIQMSCLGGPKAKEGSQMQISKEQT